MYSRLGNKCEFIRPSITNGNGVSGWRGVALLMAVQFLLPTLTCYEKSGNFPRKTSASLKLRTPLQSYFLIHFRIGKANAEFVSYFLIVVKIEKDSKSQ